MKDKEQETLLIPKATEIKAVDKLKTQKFVDSFKIYLAT